ncbi:MAG: cytochrome c, partial [Armatimonadota bacterium]|nr:cytochrome c [Armatimonadota bacterium]
QRSRLTKMLALTAVTLAAVTLAGCHTDMWHQPKLKAQSENRFFVDGKTDRTPVANTVAVGHLRAEQAFYTGKEGGKHVSQIPVPVTMELLKRGQVQYNAFCSPCHGKSGDGQGMIAQRGLALRRQPASFHTDRLRGMPIGYFYDVITNGFGVMYGYASRIEPEDRWAVAAYVRVLQKSYYMKMNELTPEDIQRLQEETKNAEGTERTQ